LILIIDMIIGQTFEKIIQNEQVPGEMVKF